MQAQTTTGRLSADISRRRVTNPCPTGGQGRLADRMRRLASALLLPLALAAVAAASSCSTVEETGRRQFNVFDEGTLSQMGVDAYKQALEGKKISTDRQLNDMVNRVGSRIAEVTQKAREYQWEFKVIEDDATVNAWALPGGKVAVYTGILKVTQDEAGLATVLGHEIAHATAKHGGERMSWDVLRQLGATGLAVALQNRDPTAVQAVMTAFGIGTEVGVMMPFGRNQESEADEIGLEYMAKAGYDPEKAVEFWQRMEAMASGPQVPEFLSTHPSHETRIKRIRELLPEAKQHYRPRDRENGGFQPAVSTSGSRPR